MRVSVLGETRAESDGGVPLRLGTRKQRALLAAVTLHLGQAASRDTLVALMWPDGAPPGVAGTLQAYASNLRKALEPGRGGRGAPSVLRSAGSGYALALPAEAVDARRLESAVREARLLLGPAAADVRHIDAGASGGSGGSAVLLLEASLDLCHGVPYADLDDAGPARDERLRLEDLQVAAEELLATARLAVGDAATAASALARLTAQHPLRERLWALLALALVRTGRQADALGTFRHVRAMLADELGVDPGPELTALEAAVLRQDPSLVARAAAVTLRPPPAPAREQQAPAVVDGGPGALLPVPLTELVGRQHDLADLMTQLHHGSARLVTMLGPGGTGKTRLAAAAAGAARASAGFEGGTYWVELAAVTDPALVLPTLARALGLHDVQPANAEQRLTDHLQASGRVLLVLDNVEQVAAAGPALAALLARCTQVTALVTSRLALRVAGEQRWPVGPLSMPASGDAADLAASSAVRLFLQRVRGVDPLFELTPEVQPQIAAVCTLLDGLPLALELAAATMPVLSPGELLVGLRQPLEVLVDGAADLTPRQRTMRATIVWSHELLGPDAQQMLSWLGVFRGGCDLAAAAAVADRGDVRPLLTTLADHSLVHVQRSSDGRTRVRLLETVREYAFERLVASGQDEQACDRHAQHFEELAAAAELRLTGPDQLDWLRRLDGDLDNVRAALGWLRRTGKASRRLRLATTLVGYWWRRGFLTEGRAVLLDALAQAGPTSASDVPGRMARAQAQVAVARLVGYAGERAAARQLLDDAVAAWRGLPPDVDVRRGLGTALNQLGRMGAETTPDPDWAGPLFAESAALFSGLDDPVGLAESLSFQAHFIHMPARRYTVAKALHERVLAITTERQDTRGIAVALLDLGEVARAQGDMVGAEQLLARCTPLFEQLDDRWYLGAAQHNLAYCVLHRGDDERAEQLFTQAAELHHRIDDRRGAAECLAGRAAVAGYRGQLEDARALLNRADVLLDQLGCALDHVDQLEHDRTGRLLTPAGQQAGRPR